MAPQQPHIAVVVLTLNEERHIQACLESARWADRLIVFDAYSDDATIDLAKQAGARVIQHHFENFSKQRNAALAAVQSDWVLFLDADERATPALADEVRTVVRNCEENGFWIPRYNYIMGHRMRGSGWYPDHQMRLLRHGCAHYNPDRAVHELVDLDGEPGYLRSHMIHYNYETLGQFMRKQQRYLAYDVEILLEAGERPRIYTPYREALRHFWWRFVQLKGWQDTVWGLLLSLLMSYYELRKYRRVRSVRNRESRGP
jgi:hypothetical protein